MRTINSRFSLAGITTFLGTVVILAAMQIAHAEILYQWREADGSLTFSPEPPPEGSDISFTVVKPDDGINPVALPDSGEQGLPSTTGSSPQPAAAIVPAEPEADVQVAYAPSTKPQTTGSELPQGITAVAAGTANQSTGNTVADTTGDQALQASLIKKRQCGDLQKRIIALENQMSHSSTDADMDRAVLAMVRYQDSYDNYCGN